MIDDNALKFAWIMPHHNTILCLSDFISPDVVFFADGHLMLKFIGVASFFARW